MGHISCVWISLMCALAVFPAAAAGQAVQGRVVDGASGQGIAAATVVLRSTTHALRAESDSSGRFRIAADVPGRYVLVVSHADYLDVRTLDVTLERGTTRDVQVELRRDVIAGDTLLVEAGDARHDASFEGAMARYRNMPNYGDRRVVTHSDPELRVAMKVGDALRFFPPHGCTILMHDGMAARGDQEDWLELPSDAMEAVEFYRRAQHAPRGLRERAMAMDPENYMLGCSIVALWSRRTPTQTSKPLLKVVGAAAASVLLVVLLR